MTAAEPQAGHPEALTDDERDLFCEEAAPLLADAMESIGIEDADLSDGRMLADALYCAGWRRPSDRAVRGTAEPDALRGEDDLIDAGVALMAQRGVTLRRSDVGRLFDLWERVARRWSALADTEAGERP